MCAHLAFTLATFGLRLMVKILRGHDHLTGVPLPVPGLPSPLGAAGVGPTGVGAAVVGPTGVGAAGVETTVVGAALVVSTVIGMVATEVALEI